jgi:hypothetical protein
MNGLTYVFRTLSLLKIIIMLFIKSVPSYVFCEKEPSEEDKIEKAFQTMLPFDRVIQHQYCARNYQHYSRSIRDLLQAEKYDELTIKNHHQLSVGSAPLPEVHNNEQNQNKSIFQRIRIQRKMVRTLSTGAIGKRIEICLR